MWLCQFAILTRRRCTGGTVGSTQWANTCLVHYVGGCRRAPNQEGMQDDIPAAYQNLHVGMDEARCLARARDHFEWCNNLPHQHVVVVFVPTGATESFPRDEEELPEYFTASDYAVAVTNQYLGLTARTVQALQRSEATKIQFPFTRTPVLVVPEPLAQGDNEALLWHDVSSNPKFRVYEQELTPDMIYVGVGGKLESVDMFAALRAKRAILLQDDLLRFAVLKERYGRKLCILHTLANAIARTVRADTACPCRCCIKQCLSKKIERWNLTLLQPLMQRVAQQGPTRENTCGSTMHPQVPPDGDHGPRLADPRTAPPYS